MTHRFKRSITATLTLAASAVLLAGCAGVGMGKPQANAALTSTGAAPSMNVTGNVRFTALDHGVRVEGEIKGLRPGQEQGLHIHEKGDCGDKGNAAGGHFNPGGGTHGMFGSPGTHSGDLPSLVADAQGNARFRVDVHTISLTDGAANNIVGRAVVVHRDRDDYTSQPAGNSGPRVACAIIQRS